MTEYTAKITMLRQVVVRIDTFPQNNGNYKILTRLVGHDKRMLDLAAQSLGLTQADLSRALMINGAREVLRQLGVPEPKVVLPNGLQLQLAPPTDDDEPVSGTANSD